MDCSEGVPAGLDTQENNGQMENAQNSGLPQGGGRILTHGCKFVKLVLLT